MLIIFLGISLITLQGCMSSKLATSDNRIKTQKSLRVKNSASDFIRFWEVAKGGSHTERVAEFERIVEPTFPEFYKYKYQKWDKQRISKTSGLEKIFNSYPEIEIKFKEKAKTLEQEIKVNLPSFLRRFPDFDPNIDVYITHSLGEMDGGTREINGKTFFIFGIDGIIRYHNASTETPFFHHELFHVYHEQFFRHEQRLWEALWAEGLATYVSEVLNPGSSFADLMLDVPEGLVPACKKKLKYLFTEYAKILDSKDEDDYARWFYISSKDPEIPARAGYYLGYLVAKELSRKYSLDDLIKKDSESLKKLVVSEVLRKAKQS